MSPKAKGPVKTAEEKAAEKAAKAAEKQRADYLKAAKQGETRKVEAAPLERSRGAGRINPIPQGRRVKYGRCVLLDQG